MYLEQTRSVFTGLNSDGDPMFEVVCGKYPAYYTVKVLEDGEKRFLCMYSGTGLLLDEAIFLANQNIQDIYHFKKTVVSQAKIPADEVALIREDMLAIHHCGITCPIYPNQTVKHSLCRYTSLSQSSYNAK